MFRNNKCFDTFTPIQHDIYSPTISFLFFFKRCKSKVSFAPHPTTFALTTINSQSALYICYYFECEKKNL